MLRRGELKVHLMKKLGPSSLCRDWHLISIPVIANMGARPGHPISLFTDYSMVGYPIWVPDGALR